MKHVAVEILAALASSPHEAEDAYSITEDIRSRGGEDYWRGKWRPDFFDALETLDALKLIAVKRIPEIHENGWRLTELGRAVHDFSLKDQRDGGTDE